MDLGGTVDYRRVVDEFCYRIPFPIACTTDYYILRQTRCLRRLLGFRFCIVIIGLWFIFQDIRAALLSVDILSFSSLYHYYYLLHFYSFSLQSLGLLSCFFLKHHSLYLANFHISFEVSLPSSHSYTYICSGFS
ncbi:hypothetical protein F5146DRAFT_705711 [Armillaria mellea]|nr:hypothetical protein F5146DRAFT_705711 [Armillaria mellea]